LIGLFYFAMPIAMRSKWKDKNRATRSSPANPRRPAGAARGLPAQTWKTYLSLGG